MTAGGLAEEPTLWVQKLAALTGNPVQRMLQSAGPTTTVTVVALA
jgi:hypothetical protein